MPRPRRPLWLAAIAAVLTFVAVFGIWNRQQNESAARNTPAAPTGLFQESQARGTSLTAVGRVTGMAVPCTAWLLDVDAQSTDPAYAVTAGRCAGIDDSATVLAGEPTPGAKVEFNTFASLTTAVRVSPVTVPIEEVAWASMRGTDLAILELGATYGELSAQGVAPIRPVAPLAEGGQILVASVPVAGIGPDEQHLRGSRCEIGASTTVVEGPWVFRDVGSSDCEGILGGSAGAPAFNPAGEAVGMVATSTIAAPEGADCGVGRPCAVASGSVAMQPDTTYLVELARIGSCFADGGFALGGDCPLEDPSGVVVASVDSSTVGAGSEVVVDVEGPAGEPLATPTIGALAGPLTALDCWDGTGWADVAVEQGRAVVTAPAQQGLALLCIGSAAQPTPLVVTVSRTGPDAGAIQVEQVPVAEGIRVAPVPDPPQFTRFAWVIEPGPRGDCSTAEGFVEFTGEPALIQAADLPATVCVIAYDDAGAASAPTAIRVE
jgi:hypothetical protein